MAVKTITSSMWWQSIVLVVFDGEVYVLGGEEKLRVAGGDLERTIHGYTSDLGTK